MHTHITTPLQLNPHQLLIPFPPPPPHLIPTHINPPHNSFSFEAFTHVRGVLSRWDHWLGDVPSAVRYAPYTPLKHKVRLCGRGMGGWMDGGWVSCA